MSNINCLEQFIYIIYIFICSVLCTIMCTYYNIYIYVHIIQLGIKGNNVYRISNY